jgi:type VI protein secretion system component VasK
MSATSEILLQQIQKLENDVNTLSQVGADTTILKESLKVLYDQFNAANRALTENRVILKG